MAFTVPPSEKDDPKNRFEFIVNGKTYSVVKLGFAPGEASLLFEQGDEIAGSLACFDDPDARAAYLSLDTRQRQALDAEWVAASRVSPGESQDSADS
jgi:hypothetical protein